MKEDGCAGLGVRGRAHLFDGLVHALFGTAGAAAAVFDDAEFGAQVTQVACPVLDGGFDLPFGDSPTDADLHGAVPRCRLARPQPAGKSLMTRPKAASPPVAPRLTKRMMPEADTPRRPLKGGWAAECPERWRRTWLIW